jgi:chemosensory pili system protein ChpA (sensor histidine kinase/response regulator)
MSEAVSQTLVWVNEELASTFQEARQALEEYMERPEQSAALQRCAERMHEANGALMMVEVQGAALLAEEVELVVRRLLEETPNTQVRNESLDALSRAMVQLPSYMERVISGGRDIPLILLPLLNDLRAVRGQPLFSENTLLLLNLPAERRIELARQPHTPPSGADIAILARTLRPRFQAALLGWIRGERPESSLAVMADVTGELEDASAEDRCYQLWWVASGIIEALRQGGLESTAAVKRLLGQVDRQIRRVIEEGEISFEASPPVALLNSLLFYVARSTSRGRRVAAIRRCFSLGELLPAEDEVEGARDSLSGPSIKLMQTVGSAIKEDLTRVKDVLDIFVRTGMKQADDLMPQLDLLKKIGDTLGVLGLSTLQDIVQQQADRMREIASGEADADEESLLSLAARLIEVEDTLENQLVALVTEDAAPGEAGDLEELEANKDFQSVTAAVLRECGVNIGRVKDAIIQSLEAPIEPHVLDEVPIHLRGVTAGLLMLDRTRAVNVVERIGSGIKRWLSIGDAVPSREALDRLADAIVSLEYYMETIETGRSDPMYMLDNAEGCLASLDAMSGEDDLLEMVDDEIEETVLISSIPEDGLQSGEFRDSGETAQVLDFAPPLPRVGPEAGHIDPELLELFIEEAGELCEIMEARLPEWQQDSSNQDALAEVRRQFHTLKGSGRMVGAELIGEFGWAIENLLNRLVTGTVERIESIVLFLQKAIELVPRLVEQLESGRSPQADVQAYISQAQAFAESRPDAAEKFDRLFADTTEDGQEPTEQPSTPDQMDPVLRDIFTKEATGHLGVIQDYLGECSEKVAPYVVTEELYRACHTLSGSANMAGVMPAVRLAVPLNQFVRRLYDDGAGLPGDVLPLCQQAADLVSQMIDAVRDGRNLDIEVDDLADELSHHFSEYVVRAEAEESDAIVDESPALIPETDEEQSIEAQQAAGLADQELITIDPEIAEIFREEATEILERCDEIVDVWRRDPTAPAYLEELQRQLHTLKGGARLAGLTVMGDLSHELESLISDLGSGQTPASDDACELVQRSLDELHRMSEAIHTQAEPGPDIGRSEALPVSIETEPQEATEERVEFDVSDEVVEIESREASGELTKDPAAEDTESLAEEETAREAVESDEADESTEKDAAEEELVEIEIPDVMIAALPSAAAAPESSVRIPVGAVPTDTEDQFTAPTPDLPHAGIPLPEWMPPAASAPQLQAIAWPVAEEAIESPPTDEAEPQARPRSDESITEIPQEIALEKEELQVTTPALSARSEVARVDAGLLEDLLNSAGEVSIFRSRLEQQIGSIEFNLEELDQTVVRLRDQLRKMEMETEAQILHGHQSRAPKRHDFDPLEMDRYSVIQQLSRALAETSSDVSSIQHLLVELSTDAETLLTQQSRAISELQDGLIRTRMVPFSRHAQRLNRIVRQAAQEEEKLAELHITGGTSELDRQVMENMLAPLEHILRNAVIHGIEKPEVRVQKEKPETGRIGVSLRRDGAELTLEISDDGAGLNFEEIKRRAELMGFVQPGQPLSEDAAAEIILKPGFSTAVELTQSAGRGVGMDVVATEVRALGGSLRVDSRSDKGTRLIIRLPYTRAITQALILRCGSELFALPLPTVEGVARIQTHALEKHLGEHGVPYHYGDREYHFRHLAALVDGVAEAPVEQDANIPIVLVRAGDQSTALLSDEMLGAREIVVKTLGPQFSSIPGVSGATILGDGRIVVILDAGALIRSKPEMARTYAVVESAESKDERTFVMVVDDSITVRRVTERLLERNGMRVVTAKDGVDAVSLLRDHIPDVMLLDIEMPRMDGYEVAKHVRNDPQLRDIPIIMITSRVGQKHRARAIESGVDDYLGKPYQENQLLTAIERLTQEEREGSGSD